MRFDVLLAVLHICPWEVRQRLRSCGATCKLLCISCLTEIRVVVFITLKTPKSLINNEIRAARPGGSKPPPSLGVRLKLARKSGRGSFLLFCASASDQTSEMLILHRELSSVENALRNRSKATGLSFEEVAQVLRNSLTSSSVVSV